MGKNAQQRRLCIHIGEDERWYGQPLYEALLARARREGLFRGRAVRSAAGFGAKGLPVVVEIIDAGPKIDALLPGLEEMIDDALITVEDVPARRYRMGGRAERA